MLQNALLDETQGPALGGHEFANDTGLRGEIRSATWRLGEESIGQCRIVRIQLGRAA
jgi:hypothetical protein